MKPLVLAVLSVLVCAPALLRAQPAPPLDDGERLDVVKLKKKYAKGGQKPEVPAVSAVKTDGGMSIADLEALLLEAPGCKKNSDDTAQLAADLKGKYGLVSCRDAAKGLQQIVLVPQDVVRQQQLTYGSAGEVKLLRARFVDHYLVLEFDKQVQYLDLLKQDKGAAGFALSGLVVNQDLARFEDMVIFKDALKNYGGVKADSELLSTVSALTVKAVGSKPYRIEASNINDALVVVVTSEGGVFQIWPEKKPHFPMSPNEK